MPREKGGVIATGSLGTSKDPQHARESQLGTGRRPEKKELTRSNEGPAGVAATVAQKYTVEGIDHPVWRPVNHSSQAKNHC